MNSEKCQYMSTTKIINKFNKLRTNFQVIKFMGSRRQCRGKKKYINNGNKEHEGDGKYILLPLQLEGTSLCKKIQKMNFFTQKSKNNNSAD